MTNQIPPAVEREIEERACKKGLEVFDSVEALAGPTASHLAETAKTAYIAGARSQYLEDRKVIEELVGALYYYSGNFDGKEGTRWNKDMFFIETNVGTTQTAFEGERAIEAIKKYNAWKGGGRG